MAAPMLARAANEAANIDQCRNGTIAAPAQCADSAWVNGNLGETNSHYREADSVPFRATLTNIDTSVASHTLVIQYDTLQSGKHAYDYLTSYNRTETTADPTTGLSGLTAGNCFPIPLDTTIAFANPSSTQASGCIQIWNGTITNVVYGTLDSAGQRSVTVTFSATDPTVLIAWGGHIASQIDWGAGNSAGAISGSPYHMRLLTLDNTQLGNQDRSLKAAAILPVPTVFTTQANPSQVTLGQGTVTDTATLSGSNGAVTGTVKFFVCGPSVSNPDCTFGGTQVGNAKTISGGQAVSDAFTPSAPGHYCFRGEYTPDAFAPYSPGNETDQTNECFEVVPPTTSLTTDAGGPYDIGADGTVDLSDTAHLSGGTSNAGGTITFSLFSDAQCKNQVGSDVTASVSGADGKDYPSPSITVNAAGTYHWVASYSGDSNNSASSTACLDAGENPVVNSLATSLTTDAGGPFTIGADGTVALSDTAHLSGGTSNAGGTITFSLFSDAQCKNQVGSDVTASVSGADGKDYPSPSITVNAAGTYHWVASYSGDTNNDPSSTACLDEGENPVVNSRPTSLTTDAGGPYDIGPNGTVDLSDTAHLSGGASNAGGTITFSLFSDAQCQNQVGSDVTASVNGADGKNYPSPSITVNAAGTYHWVASYNGDSNNNAATTACLDDGENPVVNSLQTSLSTNAGGPFDIGPDGTVDLTDTATLSGGTSNASGTITFKLYSDAQCQNQVGSDVTVAVGKGADGKDYTSPAITVSKAGTYHWVASYDGDTNNSGSASACGDENENPVVNKLATSLTTDAGGPYRLSGGNNPSVDLSDTATLSGGTSNAGGKIDFTLFGPDPTPGSNPEDDCSGAPVGTVSASVDGADGRSYPSPAITVTEPGTYHWVASYSGDDNNAVSASDCGAEGENPVVIAPHISVVKSATDNTDEQVIRNGGTATWTIQVINDGSSTLTDVHVTDAQAPGCARDKNDIAGLASMAPGDHLSYTCSLSNVTSSFTNVAVATGTPDVGQDVSSQDTSHVTVINPHISVSKTPHTQTVAFAGTVTFTITVTNDGDSTLTNVRVTDAQAPGCSRTSAQIPQLASMAPGDHLSYSCTVASVTADFTNVAVATGTPAVGPDVSASDSAAVTVGPPPPPVTHPAISIVKDPKSQVITRGGTANFKITVTNTGDVELTNVTVTDARSPNCNRSIGTLAPGASVSYTCKRANVQASFDNVGVATGTAGATTVTAQDTAPVTAKAPFVPKKVVPKVVSHKKPKVTG